MTKCASLRKFKNIGLISQQVATSVFHAVSVKCTKCVIMLIEACFIHSKITFLD